MLHTRHAIRGMHHHMHTQHAIRDERYVTFRATVDSELAIPGYHLVRRDRDRHGGGIALFIADCIPFSVALRHATAELLVVELRLHSNRSPMLCGILYRPPSSDTSVLLSVESALEQLSPPSESSFILLGDINIDRSSSSKHPLLNILLSIEDKLGLKQIVSNPTRTTSTSSTLIDHIYVSNRTQHSPCVSLPPLEGSDHDTLHVTLKNCRPSSRKSKHRKVWLYKQADFDTANTMLQCLPTALYSMDDVNSFWREWYDIFSTVIAETIPRKNIKPKSKVPYISADLIHLVRKKHRLFNHVKRVGTDRA